VSNNDYETLKEAILCSFKKRKTAFLMSEKILADIHFQKAINPQRRQRVAGHYLGNHAGKRFGGHQSAEIRGFEPGGEDGRRKLTRSYISRSGTPKSYVSPGWLATGVTDSQIAEIEKEIDSRSH
jgi:hypothetical protein